MLSMILILEVKLPLLVVLLLTLILLSLTKVKLLLLPTKDGEVGLMARPTVIMLYTLLSLSGTKILKIK